MPYRFASEDQNYSDFASGRVIYSAPGLPAFPVRLISEIFQRAVEILEPDRRLTLYDPCCGGAYHLAALGFLHGGQIGSILASDIDERAVDLARRNLGLLSPAGLDRREAEIRRMLGEFGKESHAEALSSVSAFRQAAEGHEPIQARAFQADGLDPAALRQGVGETRIDLVLSDIPYGWMSGWQTPKGLPEGREPVWQLLEALRTTLKPGALVAIAADKGQKVAHASYQRAERFQIGKRQVLFLRL